MSYAQFASIDAADFNTLVGGNPTTTANTLNATWATGGGSAGYGQTAVGNVTVGSSILASTQWASLVSNTASAATHQGSSITSVSVPVSGGVITFNSAIPTNLQTIYSNRLNAGSQGGTSANTVTYGSTWSQALTFTHTVSFANGNAARYFFNSGGQLKMTFSQPNGTSMANGFNSLCSAINTLVFSAPSSGTINVVGTSYSGFTKIGGSGSPSPYLTNTGYYAFTTSDVEVFRQTTGTPANYTTSFIGVSVRTNGTQGSNGDNGNTFVITTVWDEVPNGLTVTAGATVTLTVQFPETTNIANTWGALTTFTGTVTGS